MHVSPCSALSTRLRLRSFLLLIYILSGLRGSHSLSPGIKSNLLTSKLSSGDMASANLLATVRPIQKVVQGQKMMEGAGVQICRTVGTSSLRNLDPYLMLDELKLPANRATAGFPDHPHRGFETCSILLEGEMAHEDSAGNKGVIGPGGVQWMTAGRGVIHSEMPRSREGRLWGFQLWINLPKKDKMMKPRYQDYQANEIPVGQAPGVSVRVLAGESLGVKGPIKMVNPGLLMDVRLEAGATHKEAVPEGWSGFAYVYEGSGTICDSSASPEQALVLGPGDHISATAAADSSSGLKFLLIAGRPINEPIVQHGPFVMNTQEEIRQAFMDYQAGKLQNPEDNPWVDDEL